MDINNKPVEVAINTKIIFYKDKSNPNTGGNLTLAYEAYELFFDTKTGILNVAEIGAFGDRTLVKRFQDRRGRGITLQEMLENIQEIAEMPYKEFKEKILEEDI